MSVQFGSWRFDGQNDATNNLQALKVALSPFGPDGGTSYSDSGVAIRHHAFHTTTESCHETQPFVSASGAVITWDGRLDNRVELLEQLRDVIPFDATDVQIVAAACDHWKEKAFAHFIGDWALAWWNPNTRSLILAKDFVGTRQLYYSVSRDRVVWSTVLEPIIMLAKGRLAIEPEYVAGWLASFPAANLTPYVGVQSVPPACFVRIEPDRHVVSRFWDFDPHKEIKYRNDGEYEEQFRALFAQSVRRRLRADRPILAELSGGVDSSSIVCMADRLIAHGDAPTTILNTLSYFDDSEPNWNERPFFSQIEQMRGRSGIHVDLGSKDDLVFSNNERQFAPTPAAYGRQSNASKRSVSAMISGGSRVLLSGTGGDEFTGGVPTPVPELADLLASGRARAFARQLKVWGLSQRRPWIHVLSEACKSFLPPSVVGVSMYRRPASWLTPRFTRKHWTALIGYDKRLRFFSSRPSFQENLLALDALRRQLNCSCLNPEFPCERRYPYLDRDLLEFLFAIPREQLVRPGHRRSLMRRALTGIVPDEILNRKRKAFVSRGPRVTISRNWKALTEITQEMVTGSIGIVDPAVFHHALETVRSGHDIPTIPIMRTLLVELWLQCALSNKIISVDIGAPSHRTALVASPKTRAAAV